MDEDTQLTENDLQFLSGVDNEATKAEGLFPPQNTNQEDGGLSEEDTSFLQGSDKSVAGQAADAAPLLLQGGLSDRWNYVQSHLRMSDVQVNRSMLMSQALWSKEDIYDSVRAEADADPKAVNALKAMQDADRLIGSDLITALGPAADSLAFSMGALKAQAGAGTSTALVTAAVPGGAAFAPLAYTIGGGLGAFTFSAQAMAGDAYEQMRKNGVSHESAKSTAIAVGIINGLIESFQSAIVAGGFARAFKTMGETGAKITTQFARQAVARYFADVGMEGAEEAVQDIFDPKDKSSDGYGLSDFIADALDGKTKVPTAEEMVQFAAKQMVSSAQAFGSGALASMVFLGGSHTAGYTTGAIVDKATRNNPHPVAKQLREVLMAYKEKNDADAADTTTNKVKNNRVLPKEVKIGSAVNGGDAQERLDAAKVTYDQAKDNVKRIRDNVSAIEDNGGKVPAQLRKDLKQARIEMRVAKDHVDIADAEVRREQILEKITKADDRQKIRLQADLNKIEAGLRGVQKDAIQREADKRERTINKERTDIANKLQDKLNAALGAAKDELAKIDHKITTMGNSKYTQDWRDESVRIKTDVIKPLEKALNELVVADQVTDIPNLVPNTKRLVHRYNELNKDLDWVNTLQDLAEQDALTTNDLTTMVRDVRNKPVAALVKDAMKKVVLNVSDKGRSIRENQRLIERYIDASGLSAADKAKLPRISNVQTQEDLKEYFVNLDKRIQEFKDKEANKAANDAVHETLRELNKKLTAGAFQQQGQEIKNLLSYVSKTKDGFVATQAAVDKQVEYIQARAAAVDPNTGFVDPEKLPDDNTLVDMLNAENIVNATMVGGVEGLIKLNDALQDALVSAKTAASNQVAAAKAQREYDRQMALDNINGNKPVDISTPNADPMSASDTKNNRERYLRRMGADTFSWNGVTRIAFQHMDPETRDEYIRANFDVHAEVTAYETARRQGIDRFWEILHDKTGKGLDYLLKKMIRGAHEYSDYTFINTAGNEMTVRLSRNQAMRYYMQMHDASLVAGLRHGNLFSMKSDNNQSMEHLLEAEFASKEDQATMDAIWAFYDEYFPRLANAFREETGVNLPKVDKYSGRAVRYFIGESGDTVYENRAQTNAAIASGLVQKAGPTKSTIARVENKKAIREGDVFLGVMQHISETEHYIAWKDKAKFLSTVLNYKPIRETLNIKYGKEFTASLTKYVNAMTVGEQMVNHAWTRDVERFVRASAVFLQMKPIQYIKQMTGVVNFAMRIPADSLVSGIYDFNVNFDKAMTVLKRSEYFNNRYSTYERHISSAILNRDLESLRNSKIQGLYSWFLMAGDKETSLAGAWAVYKYQTEVLGRDESTALAEAEKAVDQTQSSGNINELSNLGRGEFTKLITMFMQPTLRAAEFRLQAWRDFINHPSASAFGAAISTTVVAHVSQFLFDMVGVAWLYVISGDDDEKELAFYRAIRNLIRGPQVPLVGDIMDIGIDSAVNVVRAQMGLKPYKVLGGFKPVPLKVIENTRAFADDMVKIINEGGNVDASEYIKMFKHLAEGPAIYTRIPAGPPLDLLHRVLKDNGM